MIGMFLGYRYQVTSRNGLLNKQSHRMNDVWNVCNDTQRHALNWGKVCEQENGPVAVVASYMITMSMQLLAHFDVGALRQVWEFVPFRVARTLRPINRMNGSASRRRDPT